MSSSAIIKFRDDVQKYRNLLHDSAGPLLDIEKNHEQLSTLKSALIKQYALLEDEIAEYSKKPKYFDPIWRVALDAYELALSSDILQRRGPALNAIIDDLEYISAKLEANPNQNIQKQQKSIKTPTSKKSKDKSDEVYSIDEGLG